MSTFLHHRALWWWLCLCISMGWIFGLYHEVLLHPDHYMFSCSGDGIKNYFTFAWHVHYDDSWLKFEGMNYPYGEHVGYTDGHPLFSFLFSEIPWVKNHPVGFLNLLMLLSIPFTSMVLYHLLLRFEMKPWVAMLGALAINWMNPQVFRMEGHYALSYAWVIPLGLLLMHRWIQRSSWWLTFAWIEYAVLVYFIHPYLGMALSMMSAFLLPGAFLYEDKWKKLLRSTLMLLFPLLGYLLFMQITDHHEGRAGIAKGFLQYTSGITDLFVPHHPPFDGLFAKYFSVVAQEWEGWAYWGLTSMLVLISAFFLRIRGLFRMERSWWIFGFAALFSALFASGYPFINDWEEGLKKIPFIEQFRAPGRFAWISYYVAGIGAWVVLDYYIDRLNKSLGALIVIILVSLSFAEAWVPQTDIARRIQAQHNTFHPEMLTLAEMQTIGEMRGHEAPKTILPLPYFHFGSDFYGRGATMQSQTQAYKMAYHSGIPLFASANPRVSLEESRRHLQFFSNDSESKLIWRDLPADLSFYLLRSDTVTQLDEQRFSSVESDWLRLEMLKEKYSELWESVLAAPSTTRDIFFKNGKLISAEECGAQIITTPIEGSSEEFLVITDRSGADMATWKRGEARIWFTPHDLNALSTEFVVEEREGDKGFWKTIMPAGFSSEVYPDGCDLRCTFDIKPEATYRFLLKGSDTSIGKYAVQDFVLLPDSTLLKSDILKTTDFKTFTR